MCHNSYLHKGVLHIDDLTFVLKLIKTTFRILFFSPNQQFEILHMATLEHCHSTPNCLSSETLNQDSLSFGQSHLLSQLSHSFILTTLVFRLYREPSSPTDFLLISLLLPPLASPSTWWYSLGYLHPHDLIVSQSPHLLIPSTLEVKISTWIWGWGEQVAVDANIQTTAGSNPSQFNFLSRILALCFAPVEDSR